MRWALTLSGEHVEGVEAKARFDAIVAEFGEKLHSNGFLYGFCDCTLDVEAELTASRKTIPVKGLRETFDRVYAPDKVESVTSDTGFYGSEVVLPPKPLTLAEIQTRIKEEKEATGGNKILSQKELAARIGVSRARIRQALG